MARPVRDSDNGKQFVSQSFRVDLETLAVHVRDSTATHPRPAIGAKFGDRFQQAFCPRREWFPAGQQVGRCRTSSLAVLRGFWQS
jgi:hypothetical protein